MSTVFRFQEKYSISSQIAYRTTPVEHIVRQSPRANSQREILYCRSRQPGVKESGWQLPGGYRLSMSRLPLCLWCWWREFSTLFCEGGNDILLATPSSRKERNYYPCCALLDLSNQCVSSSLVFIEAWNAALPQMFASIVLQLLNALNECRPSEYRCVSACSLAVMRSRLP